MIFLIIFLNFAVFFFWQLPGYAAFMRDHFLVSWEALLQGRYWTLVSSVFSHSSFLHLLLNMYVLFGFGSVVRRFIGLWRFARFYLLAGIVGSFAHAAVSAFLLEAPELSALGASGAVSGVLLLFSLLFPREKILIMGIIPVPAILGAALVVGLDIWGLVAQAGGQGLPIGHGAHLGGAFTGIFYYFLSVRKRR